MKLVFLTRENPYDINVWSGTLFYIFEKLKRHNEVIWIGGEIIPQVICYQNYNFLPKDKVFIERYVKIVGTLLSERINRLNCDVVFFGDNYFVPYLNIKIPIIQLSDCTYEVFKDYLQIKNEKHIKISIDLERLTLKKCNRLIYCSEWAKQQAISFYDVDESKIDVVEFGANISLPTLINKDIDVKECRLVFIGKNWQNKGGDKVLEMFKILLKEKFPCHLTIIGSVPTEEFENNKNLTIVPFLDKSKSEDLEKINNIMYESHFLVLPTTFDCFGIVFCEASAYGVPSIASDVGGVSQVIRDDKNGFLMHPDATANDYADKIRNVFEDTEQYKKLRKSSRKEFEVRLNWDVWGAKVNKILEEVVTYKKITYQKQSTNVNYE